MLSSRPDRKQILPVDEVAEDSYGFVKDLQFAK